MKVLTIIQARLGSTRLPRKILANIGHWTLLEHVWRRCLAAGYRTAVAAPLADVPEIMEHVKVPVFGWDGDENDVAGRFLYVAGLQRVEPDLIVRITADCPFVMPSQICQTVWAAKKGGGYATNVHPRSWPDGLDIQVIPLSFLRRHAAEEPEHVVPYSLQPVASYRSWEDLSGHRWTIDTQADLVWAQRLAGEIDVTDYRQTSVKNLLRLFAARPYLARYQT